MQSETQLYRKLAAQIRRKRRANQNNENPRAETAITPTVYLHSQRKLVDEQVLELISSSQTPPSQIQPLPTNCRESVRDQTVIMARVHLHRQRRKVVDEQTLELILRNRDPRNGNKSSITNHGETVQRKAFPEEMISPQVCFAI